VLIFEAKGDLNLKISLKRSARWRANQEVVIFYRRLSLANDGK
jgi:hypothetical protein